MLRGNNRELVVYQADRKMEALIGLADQAAVILVLLNNLQAGILPFVILVINILQLIRDFPRVFPGGKQKESGCVWVLHRRFFITEISPRINGFFLRFG